MKLRKFNTSSVSAIPLRLPILLVLAFMAVTAFQGTRGITKTTEGRYAECAREMSRSGTWLEPVLNGQPHWTKPPLTYIAMIAPFKVLGPTTWAARLYLIPCYLITIGGVWWLALRLWKSRDYANLSALIYATSAFTMIASHIISTDCMLTAALALTQASFWEAMRKQSRWAVHLVWLFLGIAFMIKGPPALLVVPAMIAVWARLPQETRRQIPLFSLSAILLFFVVGFGWYVVEAIQHPGLTNYWLHDEVIARSFTKESHRNPEFYKNFELYLPPFIFGALPWSAWLAFRWRAVRDLILLTGTKKRNWKKLSDEAFWLVWAVCFPALVFTFSHSKLPFYILPLFVPFAVAAGRILFEIDARKPWFNKYAWATLCVMFSLFIVFKAAIGLLPYDKDMARLHRRLTEDYGVVDPKNVAVFGHSHPNGLSFYYDDDLRLLTTVEDLDVWMQTEESRFLLCRNPHEESCIVAVLEELYSALAFAEKIEMILVDDGSSDTTPSLLETFVDTHLSTRLLTLSANSGQSAAFWAGIQAATGDVIVLMDADGQNDPADIQKCVEQLDKADICCGYRANRKDTSSKRIASKVANRLRRAILKDPIIDTGCSMKAFKAPLLKTLQYWDGMHRFLPMLASLQGAEIIQIPVGHRSRFSGKSKYTNFGRFKRTVADLFGVRWIKSRTRKFAVLPSTALTKDTHS